MEQCLGWETQVSGEENEVSYEHVEFEEPVRYVGGG